MYIEPNTQIILLKNIPLDNTYNHTWYFSSPDTQSDTFIKYKAFEMNNSTYQRVNKGVSRVNINAERLYNCNYMMFKNQRFGLNKWFYAFITNVEYLNEECSEIHFEIDVMQTWLIGWDYVLKQCFVQREHSTTDNIGDNIIAEPVNCGEYVFNDYKPLYRMTDMCIILALVDVDDGVKGTIYDGVYSGTTLIAYNTTDVDSINEKLEQYIQNPDSIISMYMCPKLFVGDVNTGGKVLLNKTSAEGVNVALTPIQDTERFEGYLPKNKKLYTYPYNYCHIDNANGSSLTLRYEFFDELKPVVSIDGCVLPPVKCILRPCSYKGVASYSELGGYTELKTESLTLDTYPMCSWNFDAYSSWLAQNSVPMVLNGIGNIGSISASVANANISASYSTHPEGVQRSGIISGGSGLLSGITSILSTLYTASIAADVCRGNINGGNVNVANNCQQFYTGRCHITRSHAEIIDNYFTMFGYATNRVKVPNIQSNPTARPRWDYIKTQGCVTVGSIPADDMRKICSIYDNGITFWKQGTTVGDYSEDNTPN